MNVTLMKNQQNTKNCGLCGKSMKVDHHIAQYSDDEVKVFHFDCAFASAEETRKQIKK